MGDGPQQVSSGDHSRGPDNPHTVRTVGGTEAVLVLRSRSGGGGGNPAWGPERRHLAHRCTNSCARASCSASPAAGPTSSTRMGWRGLGWLEEGLGLGTQTRHGGTGMQEKPCLGSRRFRPLRVHPRVPAVEPRGLAY